MTNTISTNSSAVNWIINHTTAQADGSRLFKGRLNARMADQIRRFVRDNGSVHYGSETDTGSVLVGDYRLTIKWGARFSTENTFTVWVLEEKESLEEIERRVRAAFASDDPERESDYHDSQILSARLSDRQLGIDG